MGLYHLSTMTQEANKALLNLRNPHWPYEFLSNCASAETGVSNLIPGCDSCPSLPGGPLYSAAKCLIKQEIPKKKKKQTQKSERERAEPFYDIAHKELVDECV